MIQFIYHSPEVILDTKRLWLFDWDIMKKLSVILYPVVPLLGPCFFPLGNMSLVPQFLFVISFFLNIRPECSAYSDSTAQCHTFLYAMKRIIITSQSPFHGFFFKTKIVVCFAGISIKLRFNLQSYILRRQCMTW